MSRLRKRVLVSLAVLSVLGAAFYYFYFVATEAAVRHAEAFLFSRATVTRLGEQGQYRHFFVTNRRAETTDGPVDERFSAERIPEPTYGHFDISI